MAPPLQFEGLGRYDGHNRKPGAAKSKKAMGNRYWRRRWNRNLSKSHQRLPVRA